MNQKYKIKANMYIELNLLLLKVLEKNMQNIDALNVSLNIRGQEKVLSSCV